MNISYRKLTRFGKRMIALFGGKRNVHFLHIRKTGGTSIKSVLENQSITPGYVVHLHPHRIHLRHIPRGHKIMFAVRDPVKRFTSGFTSRYKQGAPAHTVPWSESEAVAFSRFEDAESLALALDPGHPRHAEAKEAMKAISHLNSYQWDWFGDEALFNEREADFLWVARQETLSDDFKALRRELGLRSGIELPRDDRGMNRSTGEAKTTTPLSDTGVRRVREWYARDYDLLALCDRWRSDNDGAVRKSSG